MAISFQQIQVRLQGLRPMMFDRYAGDNNTQLPIAEKMYLGSDGQLTIPAINIYSLLCAENTKSVCRQFFGKNGKTIALGISSYTNIEPFDINLLGEGDQPIIFNGFEPPFSKHKAVARLKNGIPNPKERPMLALPWAMEFTCAYQENKFCSLENLRQAFSMGGTLGIGTFRPFFGRYELVVFE